jgi:nitrate reductase NapAB chaperone NapD
MVDSIISQFAVLIRLYSFDNFSIRCTHLEPVQNLQKLLKYCIIFNQQDGKEDEKELPK